MVVKQGSYSLLIVKIVHGSFTGFETTTTTTLINTFCNLAYFHQITAS